MIEQDCETETQEYKTVLKLKYKRNLVVECLNIKLTIMKRNFIEIAV